MALADTYPFYRPVKFEIETEEERYLNPVSYIGIAGIETLEIKKIQDVRNRPRVIIEKKEYNDELDKKYAVVEISEKESSRKESQEKYDKEEKEKRRREEYDEEKRESENSGERKKYEKDDEKEERDDERHESEDSKEYKKKENDDEEEEEDEEKHESGDSKEGKQFEEDDEKDERDEEKEKEEKRESESEDDKDYEKEYEKYDRQNRKNKDIGINAKVANINIGVQEKGRNREKVIIKQTNDKNIRVKVIDPEDKYNKEDVAVINVSVTKE